VVALFSDNKERERMGRSARQVVEQNQGALQQTLEAIDRLLMTQQGSSGSPMQTGRFLSWQRKAVPTQVDRLKARTQVDRLKTEGF
jgi:hypothetical protein